MSEVKFHEYVGSTLWNWFRRTILDKKDNLEKEVSIDVLRNHDVFKTVKRYSNFGIDPKDQKVEGVLTSEDLKFEQQRALDEKILNDHIPDANKRDQIRHLIRSRCRIWESFFNKLLDDKLKFQGRDANTVEVIQILMNAHSKDLDLKMTSVYGVSEVLLNGYQKRIYVGCYNTIRDQVADMIKKDLFQRNKIKLWYQIFSIYEESIFVSLDSAARIGNELFEERRKN